MLLLFLHTFIIVPYFTLWMLEFFNTIMVSNSLDPDQAGHYVGPDLGPNCLQRLSPDNFVLFDLILYVHSTIFQLCGTGLPGLNQY